MEKGQHLLFEGISQRLLNRGDILQFLIECPKRINMTVIISPNVVASERGWAGVTVIAESHISVHTQALEVYVDVFSCRVFHSQDVVDLAENLLLLQKIGKTKIREIRRGWGVLD